MLPGDARAKYRWGIYRDTRIHGYKDTGIQGTGIQGYWGIRIQGYRYKQDSKKSTF